MRKALPWAAVVALLAAAIAAYFFYLRGQPQEPPQPVAGKPTAPASEPTIVSPETAVALPGLDDSDAPVKEWLHDVIGRDVVERFLVPDSVVRKLVATVDNLPRKRLDPRVRVVRDLEGAFQVESEAEETFLGEANYARYDLPVQAIRVIDPVKAADLYVRIYPLLQQAYEELGYPGRQFHGRVLEAIDDLLAAPGIEGRVRLVRSQAFFEFADADLEGRSAGQKMLIRMGPQHAALVKEQLSALRAAIVARSTAGPAG
jgi:hypothetical protein